MNLKLGLKICLSVFIFINFYPSNIHAQSQTEDFYIAGLTIVARDVKLSATWYRKYLNIGITEYKPQKHVKMKTGDFSLYIKQGKDVMVRSQINLPKGKKYINGIDKIGFATNRFDETIEKLTDSGQHLAEGVTEDKNLKMRYFVATDPDGNKVQIFDRPNPVDSMVTQAMFFSILSSDYINTMKWYEKNIDFTEVEIVDEAKIHYQNILHKDDVIFEIIHLPYESLETTEFMPIGRELAGFEGLTFKSNNGKMATFETDNNANKIRWLR